MRVSSRTDIYLYKLVIKWASSLLLPLPVLPSLSHMNSSHIPLPLSQELSPCVRVSVFLWHSHTNTPHFLFAFASVAAYLFPLLFCPPLERDWKVYADSHIHSPVSVLLLVHHHVTCVCNSSSLHLDRDYNNSTKSQGAPVDLSEIRWRH